MILHPAIIALLAGSFFVCFLLLHSSYYGFRITRKWDLSSGSELQLSLEKKTYLISTMMAYALGFQLMSLFLFIYTADSLSSLFTGAMCAAGTLNVNAYGYPVFVLKLLNFLFAGLWLVLNHADNSAPDYPLIKKKYLVLIMILPFVLAETVIQMLYFLNLEADIITSCCGSLFSSADRSEAPVIFAMPLKYSISLYYLCNLLVIASGIFFHKRSKGAYLFAAVSVVLFLVSSWALMQFISLYIYELPTHHCPFCMLKREYRYLGYLFYLTALTGCISGAGVGILEPFRKIKSLSSIVPRIQRRLSVSAVACFMIFMLAAVFVMVFTAFRLQ